MHEAFKPSTTLQSEAFIEREDQLQINRDVINRARVLLASSGFDSAEPIILNPDHNDLIKQIEFQPMGEPENTIELALVTNRFGGGSDDMDTRLSYNLETGRIVYVEQPIDDPLSMTSNELALVNKTMSVFDSLFTTAIDEHWHYLVRNRSPEQKMQAAAILAEAEGLCLDLLNAALDANESWTEGAVSTTSRINRQRTYEAEKVKIVQFQSGKILSTQQVLPRRMLTDSIETKQVEWDETSVIEASIDGIYYAVHDSTRPDLAFVYSTKHRVASELINDPADLTLETDLVNLLKTLQSEK